MTKKYGDYEKETWNDQPVKEMLEPVVVEKEKPKHVKKTKWVIKPLVDGAQKAKLGGGVLGKGIEISDPKDKRWGKIRGLERIKMVEVKKVVN